MYSIYRAIWAEEYIAIFLGFISIHNLYLKSKSTSLMLELGERIKH